jgi:hypothetical protein
VTPWLEASSEPCRAAVGRWIESVLIGVLAA